MTAMKLLRVLMIEDTKSEAMLIEKALRTAIPNIERIEKVETLASALRTIGDDEFDVILLDLSLPDASEFSGLQSLQNMAPKLPIIILTGHADETTALEAVRNGAQDYLFKDKVNGDIIKRAMQFALQRKQFERMLITRANYDPLTGLANRPLFESRLDMALAREKRTGTGIGIFFLDLDRFKQVNDTLGHAAGDKLLQQVAERLKQSIRPYDTAARFGGDEFALLIDGVAKVSDCVAVAEKIILKIGEPFTIGAKQPDIGVSIGIATTIGGDSPLRDVLIRQVDQAMYQAKRSPHSDFRFFSPETGE